MTFEAPWALLLLLTLPVLAWLRWRQGTQRGAIRFSWTGHAREAGPSWRQRLGWLPLALRLLALLFLILAIARPREGQEQVRELNEGIAIEMVVDRSSSMSARMIFENKPMNRLEVVKHVFLRFVLGEEETGLKGRRNDLIGMIAFSRFPETVCPLTLAHQAFPEFLKTVELATPRSEEDGTAIGDAVALAAARLKTAEESLARQNTGKSKPYTIKSKVIILLTDGRQTAGTRDPMDAAKLAEEWGIKIYCVAVGGPPDPRSRDAFFGTLFQAQEVDDGTLRAIATRTGGRYFEADDAGTLQGIYRQIDALERTEIEAVRFTHYKEQFAPYALAAMFLLLAELILHHTLFRRIP